MEHLRRLVTLLQPRRRATAAGSGFDIVSITESGTTEGATVITTAAAHLRAINDKMLVAGNSVPEYNVLHSVVEVVSATQVLTDQSYTTDGTGGTWSPA